jgi:hypothetical protein
VQEINLLRAERDRAQDAAASNGAIVADLRAQRNAVQRERDVARNLCAEAAKMLWERGEDVTGDVAELIARLDAAARAGERSGNGPK